MNRDYEALSAFLDGETSEFETHRVLRDLDDSELDMLSRWQLVRDVAHGQATRAVPASFNARLSAALSQEGRSRKRSGMIGGFARVAVAASVAAATVVGWQYWNGTQPGTAGVPMVAVNAAANDAAVAPVSMPQLVRPLGQTSLVSERLLPPENETPTRSYEVDSPDLWGNTLLLRHSEFAARHSGQGMMPYARLISLDANDGAE